MATKNTKTKEELFKELGDKRMTLKNFRFAITGSKTRNVREGRNLRREIARLATELFAVTAK